MRTELMILGGCACLLLAGCASPKGGATDQPEGYTTTHDEGPYTGQMNAPLRPGQNPRDMRDPQAVTTPSPPLGPRP